MIFLEQNISNEDYLKHYYLTKIDELYEYHHSKKLSKEQEKLLCIDLLESVMSVKEIALKYDISLSCIITFSSKYKLPRKKAVYDNNKYIPININFFENLDNEKSVYWAGFILGDGCINKNDNIWGASLAIRLCTRDKNHLEKFVLDLGYGGEIKDVDVYHKTRNKFYKRSSVSIHRLKICDDLIKHGISQEKSKICHLPITINDNLMHHFIRGLADADGCWHINSMNNMMFVLTSSVYEFLVELRKYLSDKLGLNKKIKIHKKEGCWSLAYAGNIQCQKLFNYLYNNSSLYLDRKFEYAKNFFDYYKNKPKKSRKKINKEKFIENPNWNGEFLNILINT